MKRLFLYEQFSDEYEKILTYDEYKKMIYVDGLELTLDYLNKNFTNCFVQFDSIPSHLFFATNWAINEVLGLIIYYLSDYYVNTKTCEDGNSSLNIMYFSEIRKVKFELPKRKVNLEDDPWGEENWF